MLLRYIVLIISFNLFANSSFTIVKNKELYVLKNSDKEYKITYSGIPKVLKVSKIKHLEIIDYYSGSYGTSDIVEINNRIVLKDKKIIIDAPYKYLNKKEQPIWTIDHSKGFVEIKDKIGINQKVLFK